MIFVTLGTQDKEFKRVLDLIENSNISDEIIVQSGFTKYESKKMKVFEYLDKDEFNNYLNKADIVIGHGGVGTIMSCLKLKKKMIVVPRLAKYGEHQNDHQLQITDTFKNEGYIIGYEEGDNIDELYKKAKTFKPKEYKFNNETFIKNLADYIGL